MIQDDIKKIEDAIATMEAGGAELFTDVLTELRAKLAAAKQAAADELAKAEAVVKEDVAAVELVEQNFTAKYGTGTAHAIEILLLLAVLGKLFGKI